MIRITVDEAVTLLKTVDFSFRNCYKLCDDIFRSDSEHFKYITEEKSQYSTVYCYDNK